jgi:hypothetical protein
MRYYTAQPLIPVYDLLGSMEAAERRRAMASIRRAQANLIRGLIRGAVAGSTRIFRRIG